LCQTQSVAQQTVLLSNRINILLVRLERLLDFDTHPVLQPLKNWAQKTVA
jgi:hypothetical protein